MLKTIFNSILCLALLSIPILGQSQQTFTISGYVEDMATGEKMIGANVFDPNSELGTSTNTYGFYSLTLPSDSVFLVVSYIGYEKKIYQLDLIQDITLNFEISEGESLETIEITGEQMDKIEERVQMSQVEIPIMQIKSLPAFLGEVDILKTLQLLPGVQSGNEGTSGIYVRGGSPDQNLILLDGVPVYNVSHLFGFFSVFNADAIKNVTLTKGGFPARYGGRLSSVLEINMKEGNMKEYHGEGSIGLISSKFTFEGPIEKDISSFIVSARRTYLDVLARPGIAIYNASNTWGEKIDPSYYFYDLNAKVNRKFGEKDRVFLSFYGGNDDFSMGYEYPDDDITSSDKAGLQWGNVTSALRWNHQFSNKLFANVAATYTRYHFDFGYSDSQTFHNRGDSVSSFAAKYVSEIEDFGAKVDFDYVYNPQHYIRFGANVTQHSFTPGAYELQDNQINTTPFDTTISPDATVGTEFSIYVEDEMTLFKSLKVNAGLHYSGFLVEGASYSSIQPRIGLNYKLPGDVALKASFANMTQYVHLLTSGGLGLPTDLWVPTTKNIKPEQSWQAALGFAKTFKDIIEVSVEGYYKEMTNLVSYVEGSSFLDEGLLDGGESSSWEDKVTQGTGDAYGAEVFIQKKKGNTTGWVGYTLSWANRQFDEINSGREFPFKYDRRHDVSVVLSHKFNERISLSGAWVYGTGNAVTIPTSEHYASIPARLGQYNSYYEPVIRRSESKNSERMRAYHRLDFSIEFHKKKKRYERTWVIGTYNTYNRANPFFIQLYEDYDWDNGTSETSLRQFSLFPLIPSVAWKVKF
jgi:hypothetical protein